MDLVTLAPRATPDERTAVDVVLGAPVGRWDGGERADPEGGHMATGGHAARERRHLLLPVLHAIQARVGWISRPALEYACRRLSIPPADAYGTARFYGLFSTTPRPPIVAHVCDDIACRLAGAEDVCADLGRALGPAGTRCRRRRAPRSAAGVSWRTVRRTWRCRTHRRAGSTAVGRRTRAPDG